MIDTLLAISPIDGRYANSTKPLQQHFSEKGLIHNRIVTEIEYLVLLGETIPKISLSFKDAEKLRDIYRNFTTKDAQRVKEIEKETEHDVKAIEYFIREKLCEYDMQGLEPQIHFGLTSEDVNCFSYASCLQHGIYPWLILVHKVITILGALALEHKETIMLGRTHGQPALATTFGKEMMVFVERLKGEFATLQKLPIPVKFGGAVGTLAAHYISYSNINWEKFATTLTNRIEKYDEQEHLPDMMKFKRITVTTQIEPHDGYAAIMDNIRRINTIMLDFVKDMWTYIMLGMVGQKLKKGEVGSSTMPQKINPIKFENAEGNLGISSIFCDMLSNKLPISRLQRDLTDSTVMRNLGMPIAYSMVACDSLIKGLQRIEPNKAYMLAEVRAHPEILGEAIQTLLRKDGVKDSYEKVKELLRGNEVTLPKIHSFIQTLDGQVSDKTKKILLNLTPESYLGNLNFAKTKEEV